MNSDSIIHSVLQQADCFLLPGNHSYGEDFEAAGGTVQRQISGHLVFYGVTGRRILLTDPEGHVLHECEWTNIAHGPEQLVSTRLQLDWGQWVGIKPRHLLYESHLNLSTRPGWESITKDDLRAMAAHAMNVSLEHIRFFYQDDDVVIDSTGQATIRQRKDAFYILPNGRFDQASFMSCMTAMHWENIDYLPVVELFLSLLPGTGSATFELIRGLYDDQNPIRPVPLQYRGIPPYPSEGAFRLFHQFFTPSVQGGVDPLRVFLDVSHSHEVMWLPSVQPPVRYFDSEQALGITVSQGQVVKATQANDLTGLSYFSPKPRGLPPCGRSVVSNETNLILYDEFQHVTMQAKKEWGIAHFSESQEFPADVPSWRSLFPHGVPQVAALQAYSAVLLYPEDEQVIGEAESQPFLFDYVDDLGEELPHMQHAVQSARRLLIGGCDAALNSCVSLTAGKDITVLYRWAPIIQKQAQVIWNQCARSRQWELLRHIRLLPEAKNLQSSVQQSYDLIYYWTPFEQLHQPRLLDQTMESLVNALLVNGTLIMSGTPILEQIIQRYQLTVLCAEFIQDLPTFRLHQAILPKATLQQDLMVFVLKK